MKNVGKHITRLVLKLLGTVLFIGYIPYGSGTFGSLFGAGVWVFLSEKSLFPILIVAIIPLSIAVSEYCEKEIFKQMDPRRVVIDELSGMLVTYAPFRFRGDLRGIIILVFGFILFRFFDILKPQPIKLSQKLPGGAGIVVDDLIAGVFSSVILFVLDYFILVKIL